MKNTIGNALKGGKKRENCVLAKRCKADLGWNCADCQVPRGNPRLMKKAGEVRK